MQEVSDPAAWRQPDETKPPHQRRRGAAAPPPEDDDDKTPTDYEFSQGLTEDDYTDTSYESMDAYDTALLPERSRTPYRQR